MFDNSKIIDKEAFFIYEKSDGSTEGYHVVNISVSDHHLQGVALPKKNSSELSALTEYWACSAAKMNCFL